MGTVLVTAFLSFFLRVKDDLKEIKLRIVIIAFKKIKNFQLFYWRTYSFATYGNTIKGAKSVTGWYPFGTNMYTLVTDM